MELDNGRARALVSLTYKRLKNSGIRGALRCTRAGTMCDATPFGEDVKELSRTKDFMLIGCQIKELISIRVSWFSSHCGERLLIAF